MKFWRSKLFAILAPWRDECFEESNVEINWHMGNVKLADGGRWRLDSKLRCDVVEF